MSNFKGSLGMIDADPYQSGGYLAYGSTNVFWRQIQNFIIDTTAVAPSSSITGIHWPTGQATSIENVVFQMSSASGTQHVGIFIESAVLATLATWCLMAAYTEATGATSNSRCGI